MSAYYNENDPYAAQWLRNLIAAGHIAPGEVDERSIIDVRADDLRGFRQCHFFAGIGVWSYALRRAGWPDEREVWTGSCPCQPFSAAGRAGGFDDGRHLWPHWARFIGERRPGVVFGEQVASADGLAWLDFVCADMEAAGYAIGALDTCAAGFGAPHIRQRLYFVAHADEGGRTCSRRSRDESGRGMGTHRESASGNDAALADAGATGDFGDAEQSGFQEQRSERRTSREAGGRNAREAVERAGAPTNGFWRDAEWLPCIDGKARPTERATESRLQSLADGLAARLGYMRSGEGWALTPLIVKGENRVGRLRAYGNAIVAPAAVEFISAFMECRP
jgi:DNA (cytosine-5)-methyltransferase 1